MQGSIRLDLTSEARYRSDHPDHCPSRRLIPSYLATKATRWAETPELRATKCYRTSLRSGPRLFAAGINRGCRPKSQAQLQRLRRIEEEEQPPS